MRKYCVQNATGTNLKTTKKYVLNENKDKAQICHIENKQAMITLQEMAVFNSLYGSKVA